MSIILRMMKSSVSMQSTILKILLFGAVSMRNLTKTPNLIFPSSLVLATLLFPPPSRRALVLNVASRTGILLIVVTVLLISRFVQRRLPQPVSVGTGILADAPIFPIASVVIPAPSALTTEESSLNTMRKIIPRFGTKCLTNSIPHQSTKTPLKAHVFAHFLSEHTDHNYTN